MTFAAVSVGGDPGLACSTRSLCGVRWRTFPALVLLVAAGLNGLFLTGDAFNFYVFFEISMTASFVLTGYREEDYQVRAAFLFAVVNLLGSVVFLIGIAALYYDHRQPGHGGDRREGGRVGAELGDRHSRR